MCGTFGQNSSRTKETPVNSPDFKSYRVDVDVTASAGPDIQAIQSIALYRSVLPPVEVRRKRVWIDIDNSPHVPFFLPIIEELEKLGLELILTARNMYQVCELLQFFDLPCQVIGGHYGKNKLLKILCNCSRAVQLSPAMARRRPDLAVSHGSRAQVLVGKLLGIPTIMMHDYEHSTKTGLRGAGLDSHARRDTRRRNGTENQGSPEISRTERRCLRTPISPGPLHSVQAGTRRRRPGDHAAASRYRSALSQSRGGGAFCRHAAVPGGQAGNTNRCGARNTKQKHILQARWRNLITSGRMVIPAGPVDGLNLIWFSDLVISGGGTMNREAAALGVPVYSIFRGKIGAVDRYLVDKGQLVMIENSLDIRSRIRLARWDRPAAPVERSRPALRSIVASIATILEQTSDHFPRRQRETASSVPDLAA